MGDPTLPVVIFASLVMVLGVVGNSVVCYICHCRLRRSVLNNFVLALAVLDVVGCALCVPLEVTELRNKERKWEPGLCIGQQFFRTILIVTSVFILVAIATERYRRICHPLSRHINFRQCHIAIIGAILIAIVLSWPSLFLFGEKTVYLVDSGKGVDNASVVGIATAVECGVKDSMRESVYPAVYFGLLFVVFFLSSVVLAALYARIAHRIWRPRKFKTDMTRTKSASLPDCRRLNTTSPVVASHAVRLASSPPSSSSPMPAKLLEELTRSLQIRRKRDAFHTVMVPTPSFRRKKRVAYSRKRTTFIMFLMTLTSVVTYLPYILVSILYVASPTLREQGGRSEVVKAMLKICLKSFLISSAINPFIYGFCNQRFKKECSQLWNGFNCRSRRESEMEDTSETPPNS